jgi:hypothetical protein
MKAQKQAQNENLYQNLPNNVEVVSGMLTEIESY